MAFENKKPKKLRGYLISTFLEFAVLGATLPSRTYAQESTHYTHEVEVPREYSPPKKKVRTIFSEVYQKEVSINLMSAGIEQLDKFTGSAIINLDEILFHGAQLNPGFGLTLEQQDAIGDNYTRLGPYLEQIDRSRVLDIFGEESLLVKTIDKANTLYRGPKAERISHLETMAEENKNVSDILNRYLG